MRLARSVQLRHSLTHTTLIHATANMRPLAETRHSPTLNAVRESMPNPPSANSTQAHKAVAPFKGAFPCPSQTFFPNLKAAAPRKWLD